MEIEDSDKHKTNKIKLVADGGKRRVVVLVYCILQQGRNQKLNWYFKQQDSQPMTTSKNSVAIKKCAS